MPPALMGTGEMPPALSPLEHVQLTVCLCAGERPAATWQFKQHEDGKSWGGNTVMETETC